MPAGRKDAEGGAPLKKSKNKSLWINMTTAERIKILPANRQQMEDVIAFANDPELKKAYTEMLEGFVNCVQSKIKTNKSFPQG